MNILCIGDVTGSKGMEHLRSRLSALKRLKAVDLVIANGENSADGNGITPASCKFLLDSGVDVITTGNHSFRRRESYELYDECEALLRPANLPAAAPGKGMRIVDLGHARVAVINLIGSVYMDCWRSPFDCFEELIKTPDMPKLCIVDLHAEATGEKRAFGFFADGRVSAVFGTHTHVQTADECILPHGTGYITDVGMTGPVDSVLGVKPELIISRYTTTLPVRFEVADGPCRMDCTLFTCDEKTGLCTGVERLSVT